MHTCIFAFVLLIAKALCSESSPTQFGTPSQTGSIDATTVPYGPMRTLDTTPPVFVADTLDPTTASSPTSPCIDRDCLRPTAAWISLPSTIVIPVTPTPPGLYRGGTHVKIVGVYASY
ncbi:hypothetical protein GY45DRAFT_1330660 [Cubamyces sp. BRFM 1775]|nr:hypothetical protein GY45DRAFT_1330660 [Cubamyces sp. BRFM 1775]